MNQHPARATLNRAKETVASLGTRLEKAIISLCRYCTNNCLDFFKMEGEYKSLQPIDEINASTTASLSLLLASMTCMQRFYFSDIWQLAHIYHAYICKLPRQTVLCHLQQKQVSCSLPPPPPPCLQSALR